MISPSSPSDSTPADLKIILLGDSAVGKSKLVERYLLNDYHPQQLSTYALTLYAHNAQHPTLEGKTLKVDLWDTAGQDRFKDLHPSYFYNAHCAILCFDLSRKLTYKNLEKWYEKLIQNRGALVPVIICANKVHFH